jgi:NitT/TauT family transport system permease protein
MARSFGAEDLALFRRVIIPGATPLIMAGVRLGAGRAVKGMVNGEMFIATVGLGAIVSQAGDRFDAETVLAVLVLLVLVSLGLNAVIRAVDARLTAWLPQTHREAAS